MTLRNVPNSFTLEQQRLEINELAVDLDTAVDGVQTFGGDKTFNGDVTFSSDVTFQAQTFWGDGDQAVFGDDSDFKIYYDGNAGVQTSFIDSDALIIRSESDSDEKYITALKDGSVELYYDGAKKLATNLTGATVLGDLEVNDELHSASGTFILKTADQITPGQMVTEAVFGGSMYVPYGFSTYPITYFPGGGIGETSTNDGITITNGGQIYISNSGGSALWKGRQTGTAGITSEIDAPGNATFAGMVKCDSILNTATTPTFSIFNTGNALFEDVEATSLHMKDDRPIYFGTNEDADLYYDNTSSDLRLDSEVGFHVRWYDTANTQYEDQAVFSPFGSTSFYYQGAANPTLSIDDGVDIDGDVAASGTVTSTTANNTYAFEVKNGNTNIGGLYRSGTSDTRLILKNVSGTTIVLKGSDGSITADSITSTGSVSFGDNLDLPNTNTYITGAGHNVLQVDATRSYFYGGTNGLQLRKSDNSSEIVTIDDDGNSVFFGDLSLNDDTKKLTTQIIEPVTPGSLMYIGSSDAAASIVFQSPICLFDEVGFGPSGGLKLGIASGAIPSGATNGVLKTYLDGEFDATCDNSITLITGSDKLQWTRIGNLVTVMGQIQIDSSNTNSALVINNLPYASYSTGDGAGYAVGAVRLYNAPIAGNHNYVICMTDIGTTNLLFQAVRDNATTEALPTADGAYYAFSITYRAA